mgnify:CR=1 FL=1
MGYLLLVFIMCVLFAFYESYRFIQYDGKMKRGIKLGSEFPPTEIIHYLRNLKSDIVEAETRAFIRKENQVVLIQPISHFFQRNLGFWYIGLVDLSTTRPRVDYYTPLSAIMMIVALAGLFVYQLFTGASDESISTICVLIFLPIFYAIAHPFSKKVVIKYIEKTMQTKSG